MAITYVRTAPFPLCKTCGKQMDYWIPFQDDADAEHDECTAKRIVNEIADKLSRSNDAGKVGELFETPTEKT